VVRFSIWQPAVTHVRSSGTIPSNGPRNGRAQKILDFSGPNPSNDPRNDRAQKRLDFSGPTLPIALEMAGPKKYWIFRAQKFSIFRAQPSIGPRNGRAQKRLGYVGLENTSLNFSTKNGSVQRTTFEH
jgi:hypothetical protein